jgi:hypothetical protein
MYGRRAVPVFVLCECGVTNKQAQTALYHVQLRCTAAGSDRQKCKGNLGTKKMIACAMVYKIMLDAVRLNEVIDELIFEI